jgi:predicted RNase H-like HicB family nuclease
MFENKTGLAEDLKFLASIPELCDVTFLVGETREPVCAVKVG